MGKKYGGEDFGSTLTELKAMAPHAQTVDGVNFEGDSRKVSAILVLAGVGGELVEEIEKLQAILAKFVKNFDQHQRSDRTEDDKVNNDLLWFEAVDEARKALGLVQP